MPCFYLTPEQDDFNKIPELQICIAEALYDVDSIVADPEAYTKDELAALRSQILSNLEQAWELSGGSEDQLLSTMMQSRYWPEGIERHWPGVEPGRS